MLLSLATLTPPSCYTLHSSRPPSAIPFTPHAHLLPFPSRLPLALPLIYASCLSPHVQFLPFPSRLLFSLPITPSPSLHVCLLPFPLRPPPPFPSTSCLASAPYMCLLPLKSAPLHRPRLTFTYTTVARGGTRDTPTHSCRGPQSRGRARLQDHTIND